jgi:hypothetical protein
MRNAQYHVTLGYASSSYRAEDMVEVPDLVEDSSVVGAAQERRSTCLASQGIHNLGEGVGGIVGRHNPSPGARLLL